MVDNKVLISVIVPVYNVKPYIRQAMDSLLNQTMKNIEIILIDDGSSDGSGTICDDYLEFSNVTVFHKNNEGQGIARNIGITKAKGKYIYFMDSDDYIEVETMQYLYDIAEEKETDIICFEANIFYDDELLEKTFSQKEDYGFGETKFIGKVHSGKETFKYLFDRNEYLTSAPRRFFKRDFIIKNQIYFPEYIIHEDEFFGIKSMLLADKVLCLKKRFYNRRVRGLSTMTAKSYKKSIEGYMLTWRELVEFIYDLDDNDKYVDVELSYCDNILKTVFNMIALSSKNESEDIQIIMNQYVDVLNREIKSYSLAVKVAWFFPKLYNPLYRFYKKMKNGL